MKGLALWVQFLCDNKNDFDNRPAYSFEEVLFVLYNACADGTTSRIFPIDMSILIDRFRVLKRLRFGYESRAFL